jgi:hypothetical protein
VHLRWTPVEVLITKPQATAWGINRPIAKLPTFRLQQGYELRLLRFSKWHDDSGSLTATETSLLRITRVRLPQVAKGCFSAVIPGKSVPVFVKGCPIPALNRARPAKSWEAAPLCYRHVSVRGPTYRENSHANHTWHQLSQQTACFKGSEAPSVWVRFPSPAPLST